MLNQILQWIGDETRLLHLLQGYPTIVLVGVVAICILTISKGADWMIIGVVELASRTGLPRIVIGATIVSLGTTMPEAFVSVMAAWMGNPGLALGNGFRRIICEHAPRSPEHIPKQIDACGEHSGAPFGVRFGLRQLLR